MPSVPPCSPRAARLRGTISLVLSASAVVLAVMGLATIVLTASLTGNQSEQLLFATAFHCIGLVVVLASVALALTDGLRRHAIGTRATKLLGVTALILAAAGVVAAATPITSFLIGTVLLLLTLL